MPIRDANLSQLNGKLIPISIATVLVGLMLIAIRSLMWGSRALPVFIIGGMIVLLAVVNLENRFWLVPAFLFGFCERIPILKFTGLELGAIILLGVYFLRCSFQLDKLLHPRWNVLLLALPFVGWMCLVWFLHPTGLFILGSSSFGGRFYLKVILAFLSFFVLSTIRIDESGSKHLFFATAAGIISWALVNYFSREELLFMGNKTHYQFLPLSFFSSLFLCRFPPSEIVVNVWLFVCFVFAFGLTFYTGNRTAAARPVLVGILLPFLTKRDRLKTLALAALASVVVGVAVAGHGPVWRLPYSFQRAMSFLPGRWEDNLQRYGFHDDFRAELRRVAKEHIEVSPWFGDGGFSLDAGMMIWASAESYSDSYYGHVIARNWHNVWFGMAADFGIPLSVAWALFTAGILVYGFRHYKDTVPHSWSESMYLYFYLMIVIGFVNSFFDGGHTARTSEQVFVWTGLMLAIINGLREKTRLPFDNSSTSLPKPSSMKIS